MDLSKKRVDVLLVERELAETREKAKRMVMAGLVYTNQLRIEKAGMKVNTDIHLAIKGNPLPYVGRGGLKLEKALQEFTLSVKNKVMIDIGASTGGFTDCALQNGAAMCYALDVGYNQLAWKLRTDERVIVMERTNFRYATPDMFSPHTPDFVAIDVSFISLRLILPVLQNILPPESTVIALIKPQFEADKEQVGKKGIVRSQEVHAEVLKNILTFSDDLGYSVHGLTYSPITGGDGNLEFLAYFGWKLSIENIAYTDNALKTFVQKAHADFENKK